ncbi:MAG: hypothetical protein AB7N80_14780 [Bdellovibrionales bacterium]
MSDLTAVLLVLLSFFVLPAEAMPEFARRYNVSCVACHQAFPRLNTFGDSFVAANYKMSNWRESNTVDLGDSRLALPKSPPLAFRAQTFAQLRESEQLDPSTGPTGNKSNFDFQAPYLIKLLSSSPLSDDISYYFYMIFAEKGENGTAVVEDAWIRHASLFGSGIGMQLGQFQISDLMFPREVRLTFQDFYAYRAAGLTYERGVVFDRELAGTGLAIGAVNGNGIDENFTINSPGYQRPDRMFDNDNRKSVFTRLGRALGPVDVGLFGLIGSQSSAGGVTGNQNGTRRSDKTSYGLDVAGSINGRLHWFGQALWNRWKDFLDPTPDRDFTWFGGFLGADYVQSDRWAYSALWNYTDASQFHGTGTIFEGIEINALTLGASYYFMRNVKGVAEMTYDFLEKNSGPPYVGHQSKEHSLLVGLDMAL